MIDIMECHGCKKAERGDSFGWNDYSRFKNRHADCNAAFSIAKNINDLDMLPTDLKQRESND